MKSSSKHVAWVAVVIVVGSFLYFVSPTPWAYYTPSGTAGDHAYVMRRNRITGEVQWISRSDDGWK